MKIYLYSDSLMGTPLEKVGFNAENDAIKYAQQLANKHGTPIVVQEITVKAINFDSGNNPMPVCPNNL